MKKNVQKIMGMIILVILIGIAKPNEVAALQANPNTHYKKIERAENWMICFREMEESGNAMGLSETLKEDLTPEKSNNIDVHMMRSTEYGAIAILSASGYGNPSNEQAITSTTGNNTGVMLNTSNWEWVAGTCTSFSADERYYDKYDKSRDSARKGDALGNATTTNQGAAGWHGAATGWLCDECPYFKRGSGGIFSTYIYGTHDWTGANSNFGRGVAVCGTGL